MSLVLHTTHCVHMHVDRAKRKELTQNISRNTEMRHYLGSEVQVNARGEQGEGTTRHGCSENMNNRQNNIMVKETKF